jgi:hypothetical protein
MSIRPRKVDRHDKRRPLDHSGKPDVRPPVFRSKVSPVKEKTSKPKADLEEMSRLISKIYVELVQRGN